MDRAESEGESRGAEANEGRHGEGGGAWLKKMDPPIGGVTARRTRRPIVRNKVTKLPVVDVDQTIGATEKTSLRTAAK